MHYYQFNIADYRKDTQHLSPMEHYIYRSLLDWYYLDESPIPKDVNTILRFLRLTNDRSTDVEQVLNDFWTEVEQGYIQKRVLLEIDEYQKRLVTASKAGKASAKARKANKIKASQRPFNDRSTTVQPTTNHKPLTNNHKPIEKIKTLAPRQGVSLAHVNTDYGFEEFYEAYPKKVGKDAALKAWKKLKPSAELINTLINDCNARVQRGHWCTGEGKAYIPGPAPYLNQKKWRDEIIPRPEFKPPVDFSAIAREAEII